jgi:hypothetical protein
MSIHISGGGPTTRRVVISCDVPGCPVQIEPAAAESWRSNVDASSFAQETAVGWTRSTVGGKDFCPAHAAQSAGGVTAATPHPTASAIGPGGDPRDRDEYATMLRERLARGEAIGALAAEMAAMTRTTAAAAP